MQVVVRQRAVGDVAAWLGPEQVRMIRSRVRVVEACTRTAVLLPAVGSTAPISHEEALEPPRGNHRSDRLWWRQVDRAAVTATRTNVGPAVGNERYRANGRVESAHGHRTGSAGRGDERTGGCVEQF